MRYFLDTEFIETPPAGKIGGSIDLISIGIVTQDKRRLYAISSEFDVSKANPWVRENVLPKLDPETEWLPRSEIKDRILDLTRGDPKPEFWAYYADYDWVCFCWLFGAMIDLPSNYPMFCRDLRQTMDEFKIGRDVLPVAPKDAHHSLADAQWLYDAYAIVRDTAAKKIARDDSSACF